MSFRVLLSLVTDPETRENFKRLETALRDEPLLKGSFTFMTATLKAGAYPATVAVPHTLGFIPTDILTTSVIGGTLAWNYAAATRTALSATISAATTFRAFIGTYSEAPT